MKFDLIFEKTCYGIYPETVLDPWCMKIGIVVVVILFFSIRSVLKPREEGRGKSPSPHKGKEFLFMQI